MASRRADENYRFGPYRYETATGRLFREEHYLALPPRPAALLEYLLARAGEVCGKDEILDAVWDDAHVSEESLTQAISIVRHALDDEPREPRYVETIPRRGYRFVAAVEIESVAPSGRLEANRQATDPEARATDVDVRSGAVATTPPLPSARWAGAAVAIAVIALFVWYLLPAGDDAAAPPGSVFPVEAPEGTTFGVVATNPYPALSPDGRRLAALVTSPDGKFMLWLRDLDSLEVRPIPGTERGLFPFWSPDGSQLGFFADQQLKKVWVDDPDRPTQVLTTTQHGGGSWNERGEILFANREGLHLISENGGEPRTIRRPDVSGRFSEIPRFPQFLPDGERFLYLAISPDEDLAGLHVASTVSADKRRIIEDTSNGLYTEPGVVWFVRRNVLYAQLVDPRTLEPEGAPTAFAESLPALGSQPYAPIAASATTLAYRPASRVTTQLTWIDREANTLGLIGEPGPYFSPSLSPDGTRIAVEIGDFETGDVDIWLFDEGNDIPQRWTESPRYAVQAVWSPDGNRLAFMTERSRRGQVFEGDVDGSRREPVLEALTGGRIQDWANGYIVQIKQQDLWAVPVGTGGAPLRLTEATYRHTHGRLSSDGRWIAYASFESGVPEIYVRSFPQADIVRRVSAGGGLEPRWSHDGRELFYLEVDPSTSSAAGSERTLMAVAITDPDELEFTAARPLFRVRIPRYGYWQKWNYDVSPGADRFVVNVVVDEEDSVLIVHQNWLETLRAMTGGR